MDDRKHSIFPGDFHARSGSEGVVADIAAQAASRFGPKATAPRGSNRMAITSVLTSEELSRDLQDETPVLRSGPDHALKLAKGLRAALDKTASTKSLGISFQSTRKSDHESVCVGIAYACWPLWR
jgi:hypothetical protein